MIVDFNVALSHHSSFLLVGQSLCFFSTANRSIKQPSNVLVTKVDFINKEFCVVLGRRGGSGSGAGQNSVLDRVLPGNQPEHKVATQHLKRQEGNGYFHTASSVKWRPLLELTWWSRPVGWKSQLVRLTAAPLRQTVLDNSRSTMYFMPLTTWKKNKTGSSNTSWWSAVV